MRGVGGSLDRKQLRNLENAGQQDSQAQTKPKTETGKHQALGRNRPRWYAEVRGDRGELECVPGLTDDRDRLADLQR